MAKKQGSYAVIVVVRCCRVLTYNKRGGVLNTFLSITIFYFIRYVRGRMMYCINEFSCAS